MLTIFFFSADSENFGCGRLPITKSNRPTDSSIIIHRTELSPPRRLLVII